MGCGWICSSVWSIRLINAYSLNTSFSNFYFFADYLSTYVSLCHQTKLCIRHFIFSNRKESCPSKKLKTSLPSLTSHDKLSCYMGRNDHPSFFEDLSVSRMLLQLEWINYIQEDVAIHFLLLQFWLLKAYTSNCLLFFFLSFFGSLLQLLETPNGLYMCRLCKCRLAIIAHLRMCLNIFF
jgi:hypothetical protein